MDTPNTYNNGNTDIDEGVITLAANNGTIPKIGDIVMIKETDVDSSTQTGPVLSTITDVNTAGTSITLSSNDKGVGANFHVHIIARAFNPNSRCSDYTKNIYVYSFSLNPEEYQPSGICNFTRINDIKLTISMSKKIDKIYAVNYNILRIKNGLGQLVYM